MEQTFLSVRTTSTTVTVFWDLPEYAELKLALYENLTLSGLHTEKNNVIAFIS